MTIRNLEYLFRPTSIALVGASKQRDSVGAVLARNLFNAGFDGPVMPVNPKYTSIEGVLTYPDIGALPVTPELAVVSTPPQSVPDIIAELGARGTRAAVVITAGFADRNDAHGQALQQQLREAARPYLLRLVGPNCLGIIAPGAGLNASFAHLTPTPGGLAFVAQSGAIVTSVLDWAHSRGIGFSHLVSLGDMVDVDFGDMLDFLANDAGTRAILLYIEAVSQSRKFMSAARAAARTKPVIVVKAGRFPESARAAASHTGALAGSDAVYDAVFRRAGMLRVNGLEDLFDAVEILALTRPPKGDRLAILTNGGGIGVLATDALIEEGGRLAQLSAETLAKLDAVLPPAWSRGNPVDIVGDATGSRYGDAYAVICQDRGLDAVLVLNCPTAVVSGVEAAAAIVDKVRNPGPMLLTSWVGSAAAEEARRLFRAHHVPTYETPGQAVRAFMYMVSYRRGQELLMETPASIPEDFVGDTARARIPIERALSEGREWLAEPEAKEVLAAYGIPVVSTYTAETPQEAADVAARIGGPVVVKILSPDITHKSDLGGVVLDVKGPGAVKAAAANMLERIAKARVGARLDGFSVSPMVRRPGAYELIVGMTEDSQFGPVLLFGQGGTAVEVVNDMALGLPPLNMHLAHEVISRTRIYRLLQGYRGMPAADLDGVAMTLIRVSQLTIDIPELVELDINPLLVDEHGVLALDARIKVAERQGAGGDRLAIRPYPKDLEQSIGLGDGRTLLLRPILPEDEPSLQAAFAELTPEEVRLRFFVPLRTLSHVMAARFTQIDYDREMVLILTTPGIPGRTEIYGVVQISADPDGEHAEYAIIVRGDMTGMGLGILLMRRIMDYARERGIREIHGDVLRENATMLKLCQVLGFTQGYIVDEPGLVRVTLKL